MAPSLSSSPRSAFRWHTRSLALVLVLILVGYDATAWAINAVVSQDLPVLVEIAATELAQKTQLAAILTQASATLAQVKEATSLAKVAWGAVNELRHMTPEQLLGAAKQGLSRAFPQIAQIYGDIQDIRDLNYRDPRALATLQGILWETIYGPAVDYLHSAHSNLEATTEMQEERTRQQVLAMTNTEALLQVDEDCDKAFEKGELGPCQAGSSRAAIKTALAVQGLQKTAALQLRASEILIQNEDRKEIDQLQGLDRFMYDTRSYLRAVVRPKGSGSYSCVAGSCLADRYSTVMWQKIMEYRARHPSQGPAMIVLEGDSN